MKLAVMQPYIFPYIGYFQLAATVDKFIFLDDVNYIKKGYINRNEILNYNQRCRFSLPVENVSQNRLINQHYLVGDFQHFLKMLRNNYINAPFFPEVYQFIKALCDAGEQNVARFASDSVQAVFAYLGLKLVSCVSSAYDTAGLKAQDKILTLCNQAGATDYVNPIGGVALYHGAAFAAQNIKLWFLQPTIKPYKQFTDEFLPALSIIDVLMFNNKADVRNMLNLGQLKTPEEL